MVACTSISPTHINKDIQLKAVKSWQELGFEVYSFNSKTEAVKLKKEYPGVNFIETERTMELTYNKPLVAISAVLDWIKTSPGDNFCIINSDIELKTDTKTIDRIKKEMDKSIVLANRVNYTGEIKQGKEYLYGIDVFFIHQKFVHLYPQSMHCFGQCFWDYEIPYVATKKGVPVVFVKQQIAFHKEHPVQYKDDDWRKSGRYFLWHHNLYQFDDIHGIGKMSQFVYNFIYNSATRKEI